MAVQLGVLTRNARLDAIETQIGTTGVTLEIRTTAQPANCAATDTGAALATISIPSDWLLAAASGAKAINNGPWTIASAAAGGLAAHFRIKQGGTCYIQGAIPGDMSLDNTTIVAGQTVQITAFTLTDANA